MIEKIMSNLLDFGWLIVVFEEWFVCWVVVCVKEEKYCFDVSDNYDFYIVCVKKEFKDFWVGLVGIVKF